MKQSKKDIERYGRAFCSNCGHLSNRGFQRCQKDFGPYRKNHKWFYDSSLNDK